MVNYHGGSPQTHKADAGGYLTTKDKAQEEEEESESDNSDEDDGYLLEEI